jgi:hypothetical protein
MTITVISYGLTKFKVSVITNLTLNLNIAQMAQSLNMPFSMPMMKQNLYYGDNTKKEYPFASTKMESCLDTDGKLYRSNEGTSEPSCTESHSKSAPKHEALQKPAKPSFGSPNKHKSGLINKIKTAAEQHHMRRIITDSPDLIPNTAKNIVF